MEKKVSHLPERYPFFNAQCDYVLKVKIEKLGTWLGFCSERWSYRKDSSIYRKNQFSGMAKAQKGIKSVGKLKSLFILIVNQLNWDLRVDLCHKLVNESWTGSQSDLFQKCFYCYSNKIILAV